MAARLMRGAAALVALAMAAAARVGAADAAAVQPTPLVDEGWRLGAGWRVAGAPRQAMPLTRYGAAQVHGRAALRVSAEASYGNLVFDLPGQPAPARVRWSWRLERANAAIDLTRKAGDDAPARVCLAFDLPLARVPFVERQLLQLARSVSGEALPSATLCWAWGHAEAHEALLPNPFSRRVRTIVLRNRDDALQRWFDEERDVAADWARAFGDESAQAPPLVAVIVAADADNTGGRSEALVAGLRFVP